jgi:DNA polymerase III delta prime subunit
MAKSSDHFLWVEQYRPKTIAECILPERIKNELQTQVDNREIQHLLFHGCQGSGKTTCALAIANQLDADCMIINGSDERGIDLFRVKIKQFVSSVSLEGKPKIVLIEEADNLLADAQKIARRIQEEFSKNTRFIFTCNYPAKIIPALHSRMASYSFNVSAEEKNKLGKHFFDRVKRILSENGVTYDEKVLVHFILKYFPDYRKILNELQKYALSSKTIDAGILASSSTSYKEFLDSVHKKDFKNVRKYIGENNVETSFYGDLYRSVIQDDRFKEHIPEIILIIARYQYQAAFVTDPELNLAAMAIEIMGSL